MEKAPPARPFPGFRFLRTCSFLVYPRVLWITGLAFLRKESPLAAAERPSVASQGATGSGLRPDTPKVNGLTRPGGLVCSRHPLTDKL